MTKISGFMIIKNGISGGYPFVESVLSALPICGEFLISDGYSNDGTWEVLQELKKKYASKIKLYRDKWKGKTFKGEILAEMTNVLRRRCRGDYILYVQANEIIHEKVIQQIKNLPENYPKYDMFAFPFYHIVGWEYLVNYDTFRARLAKNLEEIAASGDAWGLGYNIPKLMVKNPYKLFTYLISRSSLRHIYLEKPIFKYHSLFPENYIKKLERRLKFFKSKKAHDIVEKDYRITVELLKNKKSITPKKFWVEFLHHLSLNKLGKGRLPRKYRLLPENEHPPIMKSLFGKWRYKIREKLFKRSF